MRHALSLTALALSASVAACTAGVSSPYYLVETNDDSPPASPNDTPNGSQTPSTVDPVGSQATLGGAFGQPGSGNAFSGTSPDQGQTTTTIDGGTVVVSGGSNGNGNGNGNTPSGTDSGT